jgi:hypothetical protein
MAPQGCARAAVWWQPRCLVIQIRSGGGWEGREGAVSRHQDGQGRAAGSSYASDFEELNRAAAASKTYPWGRAPDTAPVNPDSPPARRAVGR